MKCPCLPRWGRFLPAAALFLGGCVYYNTFYNAEQRYQSVLDSQEERRERALRQENEYWVDLEAWLAEGIDLLADLDVQEEDAAWRDSLFLHVADSLEFEGALSGKDSLAVESALKGLIGDEETEEDRPDRPRPPRKGAFKNVVRAEEKMLNECVEKCAKVIALYPDSKWRDDAIFLMGKALLAKDSFSDALVKFSELGTHYSDSPFADESLLYEARCLAALGRPGEARVLWQELRDPSVPAEWRRAAAMELAASLDEEERHADALRVYEEIRDEFAPVNRDLWYRLGMALRDVGDRPGAVAAFDAAVAAKGLLEIEFEARYAGAMVLADLDRIDEAVERLRSLTRDDRFFRQASAALLGLGSIFNEAEQGDEAESAYREVVNRYPGTDDAGKALLSLARLYQSQDTKLARRTFELVIAEVPDAQEAKDARSGIAAIERFEKLERDAQVLEGDAAERSRFLLAENLLVDQDRPEDALSEYRMLIRDNPESPWRPRADLAMAWIFENRLDRRAAADSARQSIIAAFPGTMAAAMSSAHLGLVVPEVTVEDIEPVLKEESKEPTVLEDSERSRRSQALEREASGEVIETQLGASSTSRRPPRTASPEDERSR